MHFLVKLSLAAPDSFLSAACVPHAVVASDSHFFMKLVSAAPASFLSVAWALHDSSATALVSATAENITARARLLIGILHFSLQHGQRVAPTLAPCFRSRSKPSPAGEPTTSRNCRPTTRDHRR